MAAMSPELPDHMLADHMSQYNPGLIPTLKLHSKYNPEAHMAHMVHMAHMAAHVVPSEVPALPAVSPVSLPAGSYSPAPPAPPAYHHPAPAGPVLLEKKPYETKTV